MGALDAIHHSVKSIKSCYMNYESEVSFVIFENVLGVAGFS